MPNEKTLRKLSIAMMAVAFVGFLDSMYLTANRYFGVPLKCNVTHQCDTVTTSQYSEILGVPVVLLGVFFYLAVLFGAYIYLETKNRKALLLVSVLPFGGFLFSIWLTIVQAFILHAWCQYCILSALSSTVLFILGLFVLKALKAKTSDPSPLSTEAVRE